MSSNLESLTIRTVAGMTQLSEFTLRSWEKRYHVVTPRRLPTGRRVYNESDVEKLRLLKGLVDSGQNIGDLVNHSVDELKRLTKMVRGEARPDRSSVDALTELIAGFELDAFKSQVRKLQLKYDTRFFLLEVVTPFLQAVGEKVSTGEFDIYQEHAASAILRNTLSGILYLSEQSASSTDLNAFVFSTPEKDLHEFGILICAILVSMKGFPVIYLGPNLPAASMVRVCKKLRSPHLVLGISSPESTLTKEFLEGYLRQINSGLQSKASIWLGGTRAFECRKIKPAFAGSIKYFSSFIQFENAIDRLK